MYSFGAGVAKLSATYHIGPLLGMSDASCLASANTDAATTGNPGFQQYLWIQNRDSGATGAIELSVKLTYYVRMEVTTTVVDSLAKSRFRQLDVRTRARESAAEDVSCPPEVAPSAAVITLPKDSSSLLELQKTIQRSLALLERPPAK